MEKGKVSWLRFPALCLGVVALAMVIVMVFFPHTIQWEEPETVELEGTILFLSPPITGASGSSTHRDFVLDAVPEKVFRASCYDHRISLAKEGHRLRISCKQSEGDYRDIEVLRNLTLEEGMERATRKTAQLSLGPSP